MDPKLKDDVKPRERLLASAARLLAEDGVTVSTRAICEDAGVTAPTLYHYFGDRDGLLQAVVSHGFTEYLARKRAIEPTGDPIEDMRNGWFDHQDWGTSNPAFYSLMYGQVRPGQHNAAADEAEGLLLEKLEVAARRGLLRVAPSVACHMILSANIGLTLQLIAQPEWGRGDVSTRVFEGMLASILKPGGSGSTSPSTTSGVSATTESDSATGNSSAPGNGSATEVVASAIALKSALAVDQHPALDNAELPLLNSWLDRLAR